jgi:hypothetical protein
MATRTISVAGGNWNDTAAWVEAATPVAGDDVVATAVSGALTLNVAGSCRSFDMTGYLSTLTHNDAINITVGDGTTGHFVLVAGMTYTIVGGASVRWTFASTTTGNNITFGGKTMPSMVFNGVGGAWTFQSSLTTVGSSTSFTLTAGTLDTNGQAVTVGIFSSNNSNTRTLTLGASTITVTGSGANVWALQTIAGLTFNANTSIIIILNGTGSATTFQGGALTYNEVQFNGSGIQTIAGANTYSTLTRTGTASTNNEWQISANQVITGTLTINGNSITNRMIVKSNGTGTSRTLTAATVVVTNSDFQDITGAGAGSWNLSAISGGSGDCLGNSGITFTTGQTNYWVGGTGNWDTVGEWASTSGGSGGSGRVPLPQDDVRFDANSFSAGGQTVTANLPRKGKNIDWTGATNSPTLSQTVAATLYGSLTRISTMTISSMSGLTFEGRGSHTITSAGTSFPNSVTFQAVGGTYTLADAFTHTSAGTFSIIFGTFTDAGFTVTTRAFNSSNTGTRTINMTGTWINTGSGACHAISTITGLTFVGNAVSSKLIFTDTSITSKGFANGDGLVYNDIQINAGGTGAVTITGAITARIFLVTGPKTVTLQNGKTYTITRLDLQGSFGNVITLTSSTGGSAATISCSGGVQGGNFLVLQDITATGGGAFYAGASTNVSGNTGWRFNIFTGMNSFMLCA